MIEEVVKNTEPYVSVTTDDDFVHTLWLVSPDASKAME
jgi:hypothetical protein